MSAHRTCRARTLVARVAAVAGALVASGLVLLPGLAASADPLGDLTGGSGLKDLLATVEPAITGTGQVTGDNGYLCSSAAAVGVTSTCTGIGLDSLFGPSTVTLVPRHRPAGPSTAGPAARTSPPPTAACWTARSSAP